MKNKLSKKIEATRNPNWSEHLIQVALAMNTQGHSSLPYNMTLYKVFFGRKYCNRANSLTNVKKTGPRQIRFTDEWINDVVDENLPIINEVIKKYVDHEAYEEDEKEHGEEGGEKDGEKDGVEDGEEDEEEDEEEVREEDEEEDREENGEEDREKVGEKDEEEDEKEDGEEDGEREEDGEEDGEDKLT